MSVPSDKIDWSDPEQVRQYKNERGREWYERNKEKARAQKRTAAKVRRDADPEAYREYERAAKEKLRRELGVAPREQYLIDDEGRECTKCREYKPWSDYSPSAGAPHGHRSSCRSCIAARNRASYAVNDESRQRKLARQSQYQKSEAGKATARRGKLRWHYGISTEQYDWLWEQQDGKCCLCGLEERVTHHANGEVMRLGVDHDHACGQGHDAKHACRFCVRGLACYNCNIFIERVERSVPLRARFADYLACRPLLEPGAPSDKQKVAGRAIEHSIQDPFTGEITARFVID